MLAPSECMFAQTNLSITRSWHHVVVQTVVICITIDHTMSSKGTAEKTTIFNWIMEEYRSLPALLFVTITEYSNKNKENEQNAKLLYKYKEKYLNVEKKYVINKKIYSIRACSHTVAWAAWRLAPHACTVCSSRQAICANKFAQIACTVRAALVTSLTWICQLH